MKHLLDTHTFLWFINDDKALSIIVRALIEDVNNTILLSIASVWEVAIKVSLGKLVLPSPFLDFMVEQLHDNTITLYPIELVHTGMVVSLPFHHRDPFDRIIIAQSLVDQLPIIGRDEIFDAYGVTRYW